MGLFSSGYAADGGRLVAYAGDEATVVLQVESPDGSWKSSYATDSCSAEEKQRLHPLHSDSKAGEPKWKIAVPEADAKAHPNVWVTARDKAGGTLLASDTIDWMIEGWKVTVQPAAAQAAGGPPWLNLGALLAAAQKNPDQVARRMAVLASVQAIFPAYNTWPPPKKGEPSDGKLHATATGTELVGQATNIYGLNWKSPYMFDAAGRGTSCTTVNPNVMKAAICANSVPTKWGYWAGPDGAKADNTTNNPGWLDCSKDRIPQVGDTYILVNQLRSAYYGHVGIIVHVPEGGNGLWVCADGGSGDRKSGMQSGMFNAKWGVMGKWLPDGKTVGFPGLAPADDGPWLAGEINKAAKVPPVVAKTDDEIKQILARIHYHPSDPFTQDDEDKKLGKKGQPNPGKVSCPRQIKGFVDVDSDKIQFPGVKGVPKDTLDAVTDLKRQIDQVIERVQAGEWGGVQT